MIICAISRGFCFSKWIKKVWTGRAAEKCPGLQEGYNRLRLGLGLGTLGLLAKGQKLVYYLAHPRYGVGQRAQSMYFSPFSLS